MLTGSWRLLVVVKALTPDVMTRHHLCYKSATGPCYFAVTTDAIALGRYFTAAANAAGAGGADDNDDEANGDDRRPRR